MGSSQGIGKAAERNAAGREGSSQTMSADIVVRKCEGIEEYRACVELQKAIWGEADLEVVPDTVFVVAEHTGGQILGAFDGNHMVGFTLAMPGIRNGGAYLHSHMTGVLEEYRDRGVGRMLKLSQRDEALSRDIRLIEWTFDPLEMRNAYFNLNRLGAIARRYLRNVYGITSSPLHRGLATDRLIAEWYLDSPRVLSALHGEWAEAQCAESIEIPAGLERWKANDVPQLRSLQSKIRENFADHFAKGHAAVGVVKSAHGSAYQLVPWSDF
jgi:predicted GNAT superfamily acetyltransferase